MAIKYTLLGMLIYAAMVMYFLAYKLAMPRHRRINIATLVLLIAALLSFIVAVGLLLYFGITKVHEPPTGLIQILIRTSVAICATCISGFVLLCPLPIRLVFRKVSQKTLTQVARMLFGFGFLFAIAAVVLRTAEVGHPPLQNMFEVCLFLGAMVFPLSMFCRRFLGSPNLAADAMIGLVILFPAGFVFSAQPEHLPPALQSWLFIPHVSSYLLAYVILFMAAVPATVLLFRGQSTPSEEALQSPGQHPGRPQPDLEKAVYNLVCLGFPLLTLGLTLGAVWGKYAWGDYWNWDPKELWSLATFLIYVLYLHVRYMYGPRRPRLNAALVLAGTAGVVITLLWVNLGRVFHGMHSYANT